MTARLVTIPVSHYCEKARWALDRAGVDYVEEPHLPLVSVGHAVRLGRRPTVPVLVADGGEVFNDSTTIMRWTDPLVPADQRLYPDGELGAEVAELEAGFNSGLGPDARLWGYYEMRTVLHELGDYTLVGIPSWERGMFDRTGKLAGWALRRRFRVTEPAAAAASTRIDATFDAVAKQLADGRPYLTGDRFTAADLTFAALSSPALLPTMPNNSLPPLTAIPDAMVREVERRRSTPAGRFADRLWHEQRAVLVVASPA